MPGRPPLGDPNDRRIPNAGYEGKLTPNYYCRGWNAKRQKYCKSRAGFRTDHLGEGRCNRHGGSTPIKSGRYTRLSTIRVRELVEEHINDEHPLDLLHELSLARALLQDYIERSAEDENAEPLAESIRLVERIARIVDTMERIRAQNAVTPAELNRLMLNMGLVVRQFVADDDACKKIQDGWLALRV